MRGIDKRNKRGFELAISTMVVLVIALLVLGVLIIAFTMGFENFWRALKSFFISDVEVAKKACENSCNANLNYDFCCIQRDADFGKGKENLTCRDAKLNISCNINCGGVC